MTIAVFTLIITATRENLQVNLGHQSRTGAHADWLQKLFIRTATFTRYLYAHQSTIFPAICQFTESSTMHVQFVQLCRASHDATSRLNGA